MAPPPGQANIPSSLDRPPNWPSSLPSLRSVLDYLADCEPIALYRAEFGRDFLGPRQPYTQYDSTAFRTQDEVPFIGLLFGRVIKAPEFSWGHSTFVIDAGPPEATEAQALFTGQMSTLAAPVDYAEELDWDKGAKTFVMHWNQPDIQSPKTGPCITVHLAHIGGAHCVQYAPGDPEFRIHGEDDELEVTTPLRASDYAFGVGDWILTTVSLHQRTSNVDDCRDYELLARHLRVLPATAFDTREDVPSALDTISSVPPRTSPPPPETSRRLRSHTLKREHSPTSDNEEAPQVRTPSKRPRREVTTSPPVTPVPVADSPPKRRRQTARISTGGRPPK
ncbi:hypothetical protein B0H11DRAFT_2227561 [Mycena galericulata]|nr:hypothetical protein B0H11DRAFT_2227561 [Mycena galericulata]